MFRDTFVGAARRAKASGMFRGRQEAGATTGAGEDVDATHTRVVQAAGTLIQSHLCGRQGALHPTFTFMAMSPLQQLFARNMLYVSMMSPDEDLNAIANSMSRMLAKALSSADATAIDQFREDLRRSLPAGKSIIPADAASHLQWVRPHVKALAKLWHKHQLPWWHGLYGLGSPAVINLLTVDEVAALARDDVRVHATGVQQQEEGGVSASNEEEAGAPAAMVITTTTPILVQVFRFWHKHPDRVTRLIQWCGKHEEHTPTQATAPEYFAAGGCSIADIILKDQVNNVFMLSTWGRKTVKEMICHWSPSQCFTTRTRCGCTFAMIAATVPGTDMAHLVRDWGPFACNDREPGTAGAARQCVVHGNRTLAMQLFAHHRHLGALRLMLETWTPAQVGALAVNGKCETLLYQLMNSSEREDVNLAALMLSKWTPEEAGLSLQCGTAKRVPLQILCCHSYLEEVQILLHRVLAECSPEQYGLAVQEVSGKTLAMHLVNEDEEDLLHALCLQRYTPEQCGSRMQDSQGSTLAMHLAFASSEVAILCILRTWSPEACGAELQNIYGQTLPIIIALCGSDELVLLLLQRWTPEECGHGIARTRRTKKTFLMYLALRKSPTAFLHVWRSDVWRDQHLGHTDKEFKHSLAYCIARRGASCVIREVLTDPSRVFPAECATSDETAQAWRVKFLAKLTDPVKNSNRSLVPEEKTPEWCEDRQVAIALVQKAWQSGHE